MGETLSCDGAVRVMRTDGFVAVLFEKRVAGNSIMAVCGMWSAWC